MIRVWREWWRPVIQQQLTTLLEDCRLTAMTDEARRRRESTVQDWRRLAREQQDLEERILVATIEAKVRRGPPWK